MTACFPASPVQAAVVAANFFAGWLFTSYNTKKTDERKAQIERINDQVRPGQQLLLLLLCMPAFAALCCACLTACAATLLLYQCVCSRAAPAVMSSCANAPPSPHTYNLPPLKCLAS